MPSGVATIGCRPYRILGPRMLLIADGDTDAGDAITLAGGRLLQRVAWRDAEMALPRLASFPVLVIEAVGVAPSVLQAVLPAIEGHVAASASSAVVTIAEDQIDVVTRHLLGPRIEVLHAPTLADRVAALRRATTVATPELHEGSSGKVCDQRPPFDHGGPDRHDDRLGRLNDNLSSIARLANELSRDAVSLRSEIADRRGNYGAEPETSGDAVRLDEVQRAIALRRRRAISFSTFAGEALFEDPAWDMLLDLYAHKLKGTDVSVSSLCIAAGVAPTTALRWIAKMTEMELFIRHRDPDDKRRAFMTLSPRAIDAMANYFIMARKI